MNTPSKAMQVLERVKGAPAKAVPTVKSETEVPTKPEVPIEPYAPPAEVKVTRPDSVKMPNEPTPPTIEDDSYDLGEPDKKTVTTPSADIDDIDKIIDIKGTSAENMKRLRTKLKSTHQEFQTTKQELDTYKRKVAEYESGAVMPEQVESMQTRIDELESYEKIYKLESSPAYLENISKPLNTVKTKLLDLAGQYGVEVEALEEALRAEKIPDQNRILSEAFPDELARLEAKSLIQNMRDIQGRAVEYRNDASGSLARLHKQAEDRINEQRRTEIDGITSVSKAAWMESLSALRDENHVALSFRDGDTEHNEQIARPILNKAARDYGKVVRALGENGLKQLPQEISHVIARGIQLAHESAFLQVHNEKLAEENATLRRRVGDLDKFNRPTANGNGRATSPNINGREPGAVGAARAALQKATGR